MGEAKRRGSQEQRKDLATTSMRERFPAFVTCNHCEVKLSEIHPMDVRGMPGLHLAGAAHCGACEHTTWVLDGTQEGLALFQEFMASEHGEEGVTYGVALKPT